MNKGEREKLLEESRLLKVLLEFHIKNRGNITMSDQEFEGYVNAVLDRLNELNQILDENQEGK